MYVLRVTIDTKLSFEDYRYCGTLVKKLTKQVEFLVFNKILIMLVQRFLPCDIHIL